MSSNTSTVTESARRNTTAVDKTTAAVRGLIASGDVDGGSVDGGGDLTNPDSRTSAASEATKTPLLGPRRFVSAKAR